MNTGPKEIVVQNTTTAGAGPCRATFQEDGSWLVEHMGEPPTYGQGASLVDAFDDLAQAIREWKEEK